jgi:BirA family biotin operon repressor/biotin-[acetyl-CoA-carboxylase] ligase
VNIALLRTLQARPDSFFWLESLARNLQISPRRLNHDLHALEEFGFGLEFQPHRGVRYAGPAPSLCVDQIEWELDTRLIGRRISVWQRTTSTNDLAARAAKTRSNDGLVVLAEEQTAGRGRLHRRWFAPPRTAILMSVLLFPPQSTRSVILLTSLAAVAVAELIIDTLHLPARIKWPNDVRVSRKKVCGILVEDIIRTTRRSASRRSAAQSSSRSARATVIGIGINVNIPSNAFPKQLDSPAASLMELCGRTLDRSELVRLLIQRLDHLYHSAIKGQTQRIWTAWHEHADLLGQMVQVNRASDRLVGRLIAVRLPDFISLQESTGPILDIAADQVVSISEVK